MSRLIAKGDLIKNFGEYYPTPYIEQVILNDCPACVEVETAPGKPVALDGTLLTIDYSLLFLAPEVEPTAPAFDIKPLLSCVENLNFYFLVAKSIAKDSILRGLAEIYDAKQVDAYAKALGVETIPGTPLDEDAGAPVGLPATPPVQIPGVEDSLDELSLLLYDSALLVEFLKNSDLGGTASGFDLHEIDKVEIYNKIASREFVELYDKQERRIIKVSGRVEIPVAIIWIDPDAFPAAGGLRAFGEAEQHINLLTFSSLLKASELAASPMTTNKAMATFFGDVAYERILEKNEVPDQTEISYFDNNGELYTETPLQTTNGKYYKSGAITHEQIAEKFKEVIDGYESLTQIGKKKKKVTDDVLISSIAVIRYVLEMYANKIDLLPRINAARKSITEQSSGTSTGALHNDLTLLMARVNTSVKQLPPLTKRLTVNAKIIDRRETFFDGYTLPTPDLITDAEAVSFRMGRSVVTTNDRSRRVTYADFDVDKGTHWDVDDTDPISEEVRSRIAEGRMSIGMSATYDPGRGPGAAVGGDDRTVSFSVSLTDPIYDGLGKDSYFADEEYNISFGYVTIDYQALLIRNSYLARICDVDRFIDAFGMNYLQGFFVPNTIRLSKHRPALEDDVVLAPDWIYLTYELTLMEAPITDWAGNPMYTYNPNNPRNNPEVGRYYDEGEGADPRFYPEKIITKNGTIINQYVAQRNIDFATQDASGIGDKQLLAFEFQNIDQKATLHKWDSRVTDKYDVKLKIKDFTKNALLGVIAQYIATKGSFQQYVWDAELACSYNNIDGVFNDFFADSMTRRYSILPAAAPWINAVSTYIKHIDFLTNKYGGDESLMLLAAKEQIQKISPKTGTLEQVQAFYERFSSLYEQFYAPSTTVGLALGGPDGHTTTENGIPDMWDQDVESLVVQTTHTRLTEATFIEDDRNRFLSAINDERRRYLDAQEYFEDATEAAKQAAIDADQESLELAAEAEAAAEEDEGAAEDAKVDYEYHKIKRRDDKGRGCYYAYKIDGDSSAALIAAAVLLHGTSGWEGWYWFDPYPIITIPIGRYSSTSDGYQLGKPSSYARRKRDPHDFKKGIGKDMKCRSKAQKSHGHSYNGDWNSGDPTKRKTLKKKIRDSL